MNAVVLASALRTPLGNSPSQVVDALWAGRTAVGGNTCFDARTYPCTLAATIATKPSPTPHARFLRPIARHALDVAREAVQAAQVDETNSSRRGVFVGMGGLSPDWDDLMPAFREQHPSGDALWQNGLRSFHPFWMLKHLSNNAHASIAMDLAFCGDGATFGGGNAGAQALVAAHAALQDGAIDVALVVAYDSLIAPGALIDGAARGAFSKATPGSFIPAYHPRAAGACPGEAAAAMVLRLGPGADQKNFLECTATHSSDGQLGAPLIHTVTSAFLSLTDHEAVVDGAALGMAHFDEAERSFVEAHTSADAEFTAIQSATGQLGAAATPVQAIVLGELLSPLRNAARDSQATSRGALALAAAPPGLAAAVRVCWRMK